MGGWGGGVRHRFVRAIPHYLEWEIAAGADIHKRLTVMRVHVNQAVVCKDKTEDKLFKKNIGIITKTGRGGGGMGMGGGLPVPISMQSSSKSLAARGSTVGLVSVKYASQKVVAF